MSSLDGQTELCICLFIIEQLIQLSAAVPQIYQPIHITSMVKSTNSNNDPSDNKHEQKLQAVLLADTFSNAFHPITFEPYNISSSTNNVSSTNNNGIIGDKGGKEGNTKGQERPLVLCPLNNVPLLHHTIDFLQGSGVEELFLLCSSGADALEEYIKVYAGGKANNAKGIATTVAGGGNGKGGGVEISKEFHRSNSSVEGKIIWSSKLTISLLRFTDCTNAGE